MDFSGVFKRFVYSDPKQCCKSLTKIYFFSIKIKLSQTSWQMFLLQTVQSVETNHLLFVKLTFSFVLYETNIESAVFS